MKFLLVVVIALLLGSVTPTARLVAAEDTDTAATPVVETPTPPDSCECGQPPMCESPDQMDCIPDPGPKPEGKIITDKIDGAPDCTSGRVEQTIITKRMVNIHLKEDNQWHWDLEFVDSVPGSRVMNDDELAECGPPIVTDPIEEDDSIGSDEPVDSEEPQPAATEEAVQEDIEEVDMATEEAVDQTAETVASPEQGDGTAGSETVLSPAFQAGAQAATAAVAAAQVAVK